MSKVAKEAIAESIANIEQIVSHASAPFGYGSDISCARDIEENAAELEGSDTLILSQAIVRRLDCPRGALPDDDSYGMDLRSLVNQGLTDADVRDLAGRVRLEVLKDDRVESLSVTMTPSADAKSIRISLMVKPVDLRVGTFSLTLSASSASVLIEEIREAA